VDENFDRLYRAEQRMGKVFNLFTVLAIAVACMGLFALAAFAAEQRRREISVRKVLGATEGSLVTLLVRNFVLLVLVANVIAWPFAWWVVQRIFENFAYNPPFGWWLYPLAGVLTLAIALLTVSFQAIRAAMLNPANVLRHE
jgi:putative ABC transport system permease protein